MPLTLSCPVPSSFHTQVVASVTGATKTILNGHDIYIFLSSGTIRFAGLLGVAQVLVVGGGGGGGDGQNVGAPGGGGGGTVLQVSSEGWGPFYSNST